MSWWFSSSMQRRHILTYDRLPVHPLGLIYRERLKIMCYWQGCLPLSSGSDIRRQNGGCFRYLLGGRRGLFNGWWRDSDESFYKLKEKAKKRGIRLWLRRSPETEVSHWFEEDFSIFFLYNNVTKQHVYDSMFYSCLHFLSNCCCLFYSAKINLFFSNI